MNLYLSGIEICQLIEMDKRKKALKKWKSRIKELNLTARG